MTISIRKRITAVILAVLVGTVFTVMMIPQETSAAGVAKVKGVKAWVSENQVTVTWKKAGKAKKYQVYRATTKNGKYKRVKTTSKRAWIDKKKSGLYWYKVRGVRGSKKGSFSTKKAVYRASIKASYYKSGYTPSAVKATIVKAQIKNPSKKHTMYMFGKIGNSQTFCNIGITDKATRTKVIAKYKAYLSDQNGSMYVITNTIPKKSGKSVYYATLGTVIPSEYLDTSKYEIIVAPLFALSGNFRSGMAFQMMGGASFGESYVMRAR